jgi:predicted PolB exonuclease-like 3'-5' exonuclease
MNASIENKGPTPAARESQSAGETSLAPAYLVFDTESIPDGKLLSLVKYPDERLGPHEAVCKAQAEAREQSRTGSDFLPVTFQYPVAVCVIKVGVDFRLQTLSCLDVPEFRPHEIVSAFWKGLSHYHRAKLVTFNGRGFDLPLMELAAFRYGCDISEYLPNRHRYNGHLDLLDWLSNYGACRLTGGLNLLSKILGKPGKMEMRGDQVYAAYQEGRKKDINDYCMFDALDTYFVFLRTRVLTGELTLHKERDLVAQAKSWLAEKVATLSALNQYLTGWGDWQAWP